MRRGTLVLAAVLLVACGGEAGDENGREAEHPGDLHGVNAFLMDAGECLGCSPFGPVRARPLLA